MSGAQLQDALRLPSTWACFALTDPAGAPPRDWDRACETIGRAARLRRRVPPARAGRRADRLQRPARGRRRRGRSVMGAPLLALDTPWLLYRSYHALPSSITGKDGTPVNALLGTLNTDPRPDRLAQPRAVVCCFGAEQAAYRVAPYSPLSRASPAADLPMSSRASSSRHRGCSKRAGRLRATARSRRTTCSLLRARRARPTLVCSADRDLYQLVTEELHVLLPRGWRRTRRDRRGGVHSRVGVAPGRSLT